MTLQGMPVPPPPGVAISETLDEAYCPACDRSYGVAGDACPHDGTRLVRLGRDPMLGREIDGRFVIGDRIGVGGMGVVYRAWQESVQREVAVKVMKSRAGLDRVVAKRFLREARLASQLSHACTVTVIDFGQTDDQVLYLVMELLRGVTLAELIANGEPFGVGRACRIGAQLADALGAAHGHGIVHRDLKPANVMVLDDAAGRDPIKVLDFGLAKAMHDTEQITVHTVSGNLLGTPTYMAPELATATGVDARTDLYAVGVMLYEMLVGRPPFVSSSLHQLIAMHATALPPALPAEVPAELAAVIGRLLAKDPADRIQSADELRDALAPFATSESSGRMPSVPGFALGTRSPSRRQPAVDPVDPVDVTAPAEAVVEPLPFQPTTPVHVPPMLRSDQLAALRGYTSLRSARRGRNLLATIIVSGGLVALAVGLTTEARPPAALVPVAWIEPTAPGAAETTVVPDDPPPPDPIPMIGLPIVSTPRDATVEIDGVARGTTPLTLPITAGSTVAVRVSLKGYKPWVETLTVTDTTPVEVTLVRSARRPFVKP